MGQINSSNIPNFYSELFSTEPHTVIAKEIKCMDHDKFLQIIEELNSFSRKYLDDDQQVVFAVKQGSDRGVLWKAVVEIACIKMDLNSKKVENYRCLSLNELIKIFYTLNCQSNAKDHSSENIYEKIVSNLEEDSSDSLSECTICLERKMELTLPCAHSFCSKCIEEWNSEHHTCPICRYKLESTEDTWVLSEKPDADEICRELKLNLSTLTDKKRNSCTTS